MATKVFISHAHEDHDIAQALCQLIEASLGLTADDVTCTSDPDYGLTRGAELQEQIQNRLKSANAVLLLATPASRQREWVNYELGFADSVREGGKMRFYVLIPTPSAHDAVPAPYQNRVTVTLSSGADIHTFIKQLRSSLEVSESKVPEAAYFGPLLDLEQRCVTLERSQIQAGYERRLTRSRKLLALVCGVGIVLIGAAVYQSWRNSRRAGDAETASAALSGQITTLRGDIARQAEESDRACYASLEQLPFSGLVHDNFFRVIKCASVEAQFRDSHTNEQRHVSQKCDRGGTFTFLGDDLKNDPRLPMVLEVTVGDRKTGPPFRSSLIRSQATLAIPVKEVAR